MGRLTSIRCKRSASLFGSLLATIAIAGCAPPPAASPPPSAPSVTASPAPPPATPPAATRPTSGHRYSRADLEALKTQRAWAELVDHLEDIAPSERNAEWSALATTAVVEHLRSELTTTRDKGDLAAAAEGYAKRYPSIASAAEFVAVRGDIGIQAIEACSGSSHRWKDCASYAAMVEGDAKKAMSAATGASKHGHRQLAMALYRAAAEKDGKAVCESDEAMAIVMEGRGMQTDSTFYKDSATVLDRCRKLKGK